MEMANVLVVDDESFILNSVSALLQYQPNWNLDVYRAHSGEEALELMQSLRIDILITDIRMPGMSGLELARQTHKLWPECIRLLLTAYEDFSFAYEAIQANVDFFLLKTDSDEHLLEEFGRAIALFQEKQLRQAEQVPDDTSCSNLNAQFLRILLSVRQDEQQTQSILSMIDAQSDSLWLLTVHTQDQLKHLGAVEWLIRDQVAQRGRIMAVCHYDNLFCLLLKPKASVSSLQGALELVQTHYTEVFGSEMSIIIGWITRKDWNVHAEYERAKRFFETTQQELSGFIHQMPPPHQAEQELHDLFDKLLQYIHAHIHENLSLNTLSDMIGYSPTYLSRLFREKMGKSISVYISEEKLNRVKALMHDPSLSLNDITAELGFNSRSYFNRYIKRMTGYNPQQLREQLLKSNSES